MSRSTSRSFLLRAEHPIVLAAYTLLAILMSYPLITQFGDHIPGVDGDVWSYLWALGWARVSLLDLGVQPFHSDYIFYPLGGATQLLWGTALPAFLSIPLQLAFGLVPAFNLTYLAASILTGYGVYLLAKQELKIASAGAISKALGAVPILGAAFLAGVIFSFGALRLGYGIAFTNLFHTEFIAFYVLFLLSATRKPGWKSAILAGLFFALNVYVDFQIAAFLAVLTALWFLYTLAQIAFRRNSRVTTPSDTPLPTHAVSSNQALVGLGTRWLVIVAVAGLLALPMLSFIFGDFAVEGGNYIRVYPLRYSAERSYDAISYLVPHARSTAYQPVAPRVEGVNVSVNTEGDTELSPDRQAFLGIVVLALALLGAIRFRRALLFWIIAALVFALLSLGPVLHIVGNDTSIPLPFALVNNIPVLNHIRIPMRYGVMVFFATALLAGAGALVLLARSKWFLVPLLALVLLEAAILPYPTLEFRAPPFYQQLARDGDDYAILEIPSFHWRHAAKNEAYQALHQKRILRAYTNRIAPDVADYFSLRSTPIVVKTLRILEGAEPNEVIDDRVVQDRSALADTISFFNLRYAVVHRDQLEPDAGAEIDKYLREVLEATPVYTDEQVTAYQFPNPAPDAAKLNLDLANNSSLMYLGRGWQTEPVADIDGERGRHMAAATSELYLPRLGDFARTLRLRVYNDEAPTNLFFSLNGNNLGANAIAHGWHDIVIPLPAAMRGDNLNRLEIQTAVAPESIILSTLQIE